MTTFAEAKAAYQQADKQCRDLDKMLIQYLEQAGFSSNTPDLNEQQIEHICEIAEKFMPDEFFVAYSAYHSAADQLIDQGLEWVKAHGTSDDYEKTRKTIEEDPYMRRDILDIFLTFPDREVFPLKGE